MTILCCMKISRTKCMCDSNTTFIQFFDLVLYSIFKVSQQCNIYTSFLQFFLHQPTPDLSCMEFISIHPLYTFNPVQGQGVAGANPSTQQATDQDAERLYVYVTWFYVNIIIGVFVKIGLFVLQINFV